MQENVVVLLHTRKDRENVFNKVMWSSETDMWSSPQWLFDDLNDEFGFELDVCALPSNAKCEKYFTPEIDGLMQEWKGICWMNPPYGRTIGSWVKKAYDTAESGGVQ